MNTDQLIPVARALLRSHSARGVRPDDLATALATGQPRRIEDGVLLCREGEPSDALFVLLRGHVRVTRKDSEGADRELAIIAAPALIGHMGLVDGSARSATCTAQGQSTLLSIDARSFRRLLGRPDNAGAAMRNLILTSLIQQLTTANAKVRDLLQQVDDATESATPAAKKRSRRQVQEADVLKLAGVLDGWSVDTSGLSDDIQFVEDEDSRRTREARNKRR